MVSTSPLFAYASRVLSEESWGWKAFSHVALTDRCVIDDIVFLRRFYPEDDTIKLHIPGFDPRMRKFVGERVLFFSNGLVRFILEAETNNFVAETLYSPVIAHTALLRSSRIDWRYLDYLGWGTYEYCYADVRQVPPTHRCRLKYPDFKPRACQGVRGLEL